MGRDRYERQHRGDRGAYERYLAGMDASMRQKVALTAAHLLCQGRVADMGMGSGTGSEALASLYPDLDVVGVDVNETTVAIAQERYALDNLSFVVGDIAEPVFEARSLDAILNSSVLHHVTSFNDYDHEAAERALAVQVGQLRDNGVLIVRDFVDPGDTEVVLELPTDDGADSDDPAACSTARLFERFAVEYRSLAARPGFPFRVADAGEGEVSRPDTKRYVLTHKLATEFLLRKDYRADWESELQEEYSYFNQRQFEELFARLGLRVVASTPIRNPWIVRHRLRGKVELRSLAGAPIELPPTNYIIVGEKVTPDQGVKFVEHAPVPALAYLSMRHYRDRRNGAVRDLVQRPNRTVDVLPWFSSSGDVFVLARMSYPRPVLQCHPRGPSPIDGSSPVGYVSEPLNVLQTDQPLGQTVEDALRRCAEIDPAQIVAFRAGGTYYPSPGGIREEVRASLVEVEPSFVTKRLCDLSPFSTSGVVRAIEARQLLRAAQVGGLPDARLELNVYDLLLQLGIKPGPWIGEVIVLGDGVAPSRVARFDELHERPPRRVFEKVGAGCSTEFLELHGSEFAELDHEGNELHRQALEFVTPKALSCNTIAVAILRRAGDVVYLGLDDDDLPAAQCFNGNSELLVAPAWRLPRDITSLTPAREWILERLRNEYGVECSDVWELGGRYHPSPGLTPEVVFPLAVEVAHEDAGARTLTWVSVADAVSHLGALLDGHLRVVALRASHALGVLEQQTGCLLRQIND